MPDPVTVTTPNDLTIRVERKFNAPPDLVFEFHTKCAHVKKWLLGPPGWSMPECEIDLRAGGKYRYTWRNDADGTQFGVNGEFHEIDAPNRLTTTERMDGMPGHARVTTDFAARDGGTAFAITIEFESKEHRDGALESGMTGGMSTSYDRLDNLF
ncbi:MAG TPA: SRPBCC family protein, partial [Candidatus Tumulicola sp.]